MCTCRDWPTLFLAAKLARVPRVTVIAFVDYRAEFPHRMNARGIAKAAAFLGHRPATIERVLAALKASGWRPVRTLATKPDAASGFEAENRTAKAEQPDPRQPGRTYSGNASSLRSRRHYWSSAQIAKRAGENRTPVRPDAASSFLFPIDQQQEQKQTRALAAIADVGFAELRAIWPVPNRMVEAEHLYRQMRRTAAAETILTAARHYLDAKPEWRSPMFLLNWLRTDPCRNPQLPLSSAPRAVEPVERSPPREDWIGRLKELREGGAWRAEWGPGWGERGCRVPSGAGLQAGFAAWFRDHQSYRRESA